MDRHTLEEIRNILAQIEQLRSRLGQLLEQNHLPGLTDEIHRILDHIEKRATEQAAQEFRKAIARLKFEDRDYKLMRVIDGDTIEVHPPEELMRWMRDVHIRLYGVDAPESNTELGPTYTAILEKLCRLNEGRLHVVWERERRGTEYAGYPTNSFERGIGNLFVDIGDGSLLYINAILASLPDVQVERSKKGLVRAARHLREWPHPLWHHWRHSHWPFHRVWPGLLYPASRLLDYLTSNDLADMRKRLQLYRPHHPEFVWALPKEMVLRPTEDPDTIHRMLQEWREWCHCPICEKMAYELADHWHMLIGREDATFFDLLILLAYAWGHELEREVSDKD